MIDIIKDEIVSTYGKSASPHVETLIDRAIRAVDDSLSHGFVAVYVDLFSIFSDQRALGTTIRIFKRLGKPIPARFITPEA